MKKLTSSTVGVITCSFIAAVPSYAQTDLPAQLKTLVNSAKNNFKTIPLNYKLKTALSAQFQKDADSSLFYHAVFATAMPAEKAAVLTKQLQLKIKTVLQPGYTYFKRPAADGVQQDIFINTASNNFEIVILSTPAGTNTGDVAIDIAYNKKKKAGYEKEIANITDRATKIIARNLNVDIKKVVAKASFSHDLGADSLDVVELTMEIEKEFSISIPDKDAECLLTVGKFITYVVEHAGD